MGSSDGRNSHGRREIQLIKDLLILDPYVGEHVDVLRIVLMCNNEFSYLPEIYDIFGSDKFMKFLDIFSGTKIAVPSFKDLRNAIRNVGIYVRIKNTDDAGVKDIAKDLSREYEIDVPSVMTIYRNVADMVEKKYGFVLEKKLKKESKNDNRI